jgi:hypothetical protein
LETHPPNKQEARFWQKISRLLFLSHQKFKLSSFPDDSVPSKKRKLADEEDTKTLFMSTENGTTKPSDYYDRYSRQHYVLGEHAMRFVYFFEILLAVVNVFGALSPPHRCSPVPGEKPCHLSITNNFIYITQTAAWDGPMSWFLVWAVLVLKLVRANLHISASE